MHPFPLPSYTSQHEKEEPKRCFVHPFGTLGCFGLFSTGPGLLYTGSLRPKTAKRGVWRPKQRPIESFSFPANPSGNLSASIDPSACLHTLWSCTRGARRSAHTAQPRPGTLSATSCTRCAQPRADRGALTSKPSSRTCTFRCGSRPPTSTSRSRRSSGSVKSSAWRGGERQRAPPRVAQPPAPQQRRRPS